MGRDLRFKALNAFHRTVLRLSGGRVGWRVARMQVLELTTIGRRTGRPRTVILTAPIRVGDALVVVASRGGDDQSPDWLLNLQHDASVRVCVEGRPAQSMRARVANPQERDDLWRLIVANHPNYAGYQSKTSRVIPVVLLEPAG
jgi:deazaflavin-dependent oxidoreductase (nitroreductase family)